MLKTRILLSATLLFGVVTVLGLTKASAQQPNQAVSYAPPGLSLTSDKVSVSSCPGTAAQVQLNARASSPNGNPIKYSWTATAGRISGNGPSVMWDLAGLAPGVYKASIEIATGTTNDECYAFTSTTVVVNPCLSTRVACPAVEVVTATKIAIDQPLTFNSSVSGGAPIISPIYNWTVSPGTIVEGQGTSSIKVDTTGLAGQTIRATLSMGGYPMDCSATAMASIPVPGATSRKFDAFPDISRNDEKARLDNLVIELQNDPTATAYIIVYPARSGRPGEQQKRAARIVDYLVNSRRLDARRIVTLVGGAKEDLMVQLWMSPQGAAPPNP